MNIQSTAIGSELEPEAAGVEATPVLKLVDIRKLWALMMRRLWLMIWVGSGVVLLIMVICLLLPLKYTATARVMIDSRKEDIVNHTAVLSSLQTSDTNVTDTEVQILQSRKLSEQVDAAMNLDKDPEFNTKLQPPIPVITPMMNGLQAFLAVIHPKPPMSAAEANTYAHEKIIDTLMKDLSVKREGLTYVIDIAFSAQEPGKAARIANKYAEIYMGNQLKEKTDADQKANSFLNDRLSQLRNQVQNDDKTLQNFRVANNLMSSTEIGLTEQQVINDQQTVAAARVQASEDESALQVAKDQLARGEDVGAADDSEVMRNLRQQQSDISAKIADMSTHLGPKHPDLVKQQRALEDVNAAIKQEVNRVISGLAAKAKVSEDRLKLVEGTAAKTQGVLATSNRAMVGFNDLQRQSQASQTLYDDYLGRYKETASASGLDTPDADLVSPALPPTKQSSPNMLIAAALSVVMGGLCALAALILAENLDNGLSSAGDVERQLKVRYLAGIPAVQLGKKKKKTDPPPADYIVQYPLSSFAESFRNLRAAVQYSPINAPVKVLAVTSALPGEGKTAASICLARSAALQGVRTVVVDCDLRRHSVDRVLQVKSDLGLGDVLSGRATLDQALVRDETGAMLLTVSSTAYADKDVFGSQAMVKLLAELRQRFDLVILDAAPVLPVVDTRVLAGRADATVFLVRWRKTPKPAVEAALKILARAGANVAGVALTQIDLKKQARYAYGDPAYYYNKYTSYYING